MGGPKQLSDPFQLSAVAFCKKYMLAYITKSNGEY